ncbi:glycosyltransferase family 2 protein [Mesorhizobium sp. B2-8-9]|uniref:glycosyltransferase family 2 protein n=1 Tax=Mesorhizobium sp. B2-8-9 TaxID=2589899 RepID=UPI001129D969|nr:glycosyltransferase family 2 protein [Mesorhizobium sp. B2-8-9]TPI81977.1 glycosyltransferase family 2 protein [Mesorhizobium sp. B2-8-9]
MASPLPEVSIILPTYNRADTLTRAVDSITGQTFQDWELVIVDDGSTDSTAQLDFGKDPRIQVIRQHNLGVAAARNTGIAASRGRLIAFLDSDDEWLPYFLDLSVGFLRAFPEDHYVTLEFFEEDTSRRVLKDRIVNAYLPEARAIGSHALDLGPGETDDYLRVFQSRQQIGRWGTKHLQACEAQGAFLYQGHIFHHTRWGYFAWLPTTVVTRHALQVVGSFDTSRRSAEDYPFQALLAHHFRTNFISVPSARKHERSLNAGPMKEDHLAGGSNAYSFRMNRLHYFDQLHWSQNRNDPELSLVRRHYVYETACIALNSGFRSKAVALFKEAACFHNRLWQAYLLIALIVCCPSDKAASTAYGGVRLVSRILRHLPFETT